MIHIKPNIPQTIAQLLHQEDTDNDKRITIEDQGPKRFVLKTDGEDLVIEGTYFLSNLLQELILAQQNKLDFVEKKNIFEPPADRISRMIQTYFWDGLTRTLDEAGLDKMMVDSKSKTTQPIIYVPFADDFALKYYQELALTKNLKVVQLPENLSPEYVSSINDQGGILALALKTENGKTTGLPFAVPGGRFNEMYGWDSYFENVGLLIDKKIVLATSMVENFAYQIKHYGKILNANRSYYLTRTQPPFFSSMIREVFENSAEKNLNWLAENLKICITEYETVWMEAGKRLTANGLNRYFAQGIGLPPETEVGHYDDILFGYAQAAQMSISDYEKGYYERRIPNLELDAYFVHDRSVRESGHDTSYRLEGICASLNVVELNAMLFKYETDFAYMIGHYFDDNFDFEGKTYRAAYWIKKSKTRQELVDRLLWNEVEGCFFDYNFVDKKPVVFLSATCFFPLWAKMATQEQADIMIAKHLPRLCFLGGIAGCSEEALAGIDAQKMQRQWDFPYGWPPHQMIIWQGLQHYGYHDLTQELVYRWLWMIAKNASDYNGTVPEKFDVVLASHKVFAEYGNQGTDFEYITKEGFGWMNASFQFGMQILNADLKVSLNALLHPDGVFESGFEIKNRNLK